MKTLSKVSFGVQAVIAGQKSNQTVVTPQLIANSTVGKFQITAPVSKALNIAVGDNVMFLNNISGVENAILSRVDDIVAWASEVGVDLDTREGQDAALKEFTQWYIAKGEKLYTKIGAPVLAKERMTKDEKQAYLDAHAAELINENRDALKEACGNPDATDEDLMAILTVDMIEGPTYHAASGSKTSTTSSVTGVGAQLNFTDTAIWTALKADLGDMKAKKNRIFNVLLDEVAETTYDNGSRELVTIKIYPIEFVEDNDPIVRSVKE